MPLLTYPKRRYNTNTWEAESQNELLIQECGALCRLHHPNIIRFYGMSVHEDTFYLITEFCTSSLAQYLETVSVVPLDSFKQMVVAMCRGMEYLHARAMLHGDLKPENILMSEGGTPKLCDFGFSRKSNRSSDLHEVWPGLPCLTLCSVR